MGVLHWLEEALVPEVDAAQTSHQHLQRTMDTLAVCSDALEPALSTLLRPLIDETLSVVFYDLTTIRTEGESEMPDELRRHGRAREGGIARQVMPGVARTADGLPIHHEVFTADINEGSTLVPTIRRVVQVSDRGLLPLENLDEFRNLRVTEDQPLEFILAVSARRYGDCDEVLAAFQQQQCHQADSEWSSSNGKAIRLVTAHRPDIAQAKQAQRHARIAALEQRAAH